MQMLCDLCFICDVWKEVLAVSRGQYKHNALILYLVKGKIRKSLKLEQRGRMWNVDVAVAGNFKS